MRGFCERIGEGLIILLLLICGVQAQGIVKVVHAAGVSPTANGVYGQGGSYTTATANAPLGIPSATSLNSPKHMALDSSGGLYVADTNNNRVLYYASGSTTATRVYGQGGSFTTNTANSPSGSVSATGLKSPSGVALDYNNNLYISDTGNNRVLFFSSGSTTATRVYGQNGSFTASTANNGGVSAASLNAPRGVTVDAGSNIYIADYSNNRVLYFPSGSMTATRVYGQGGNFTTNAANYPLGLPVSATTLFQPVGLVIDSNGNLYITDNSNNRVLKFQTCLSVSTQPPTSTTIGAPFTVATSLIDVGSGSSFTDFTGTVSLKIKAGTGVTGAVLNGTTSVAAISGIATFSNLSISSSNTTSSSYTLTASSPGVGSVDTNAFSVLGVLTLAGNPDVTIVSGSPVITGVAYTIPFTFTSMITDHRMSSNGWTLYVASAGIKNGTATLPLSLTALDASSFCTGGTCTPTTFVPVTTLTTTRAPILHAGNAAHSILVDGNYTNQFDGLITVPATAPAGLYTGTITLSVTNNF